MDLANEDRYIADRVSQVEAHKLDNELGSLVDNMIDQLELPKLGDEVKTIVKLYLSYFDVKSGATTGMKVYNLNYCDLSEHKTYDQPVAGDIANYKLIMLSASHLIGSYLMKRQRTLDKLLSKSILDKLNLPWLNIDNTATIVKILSILNFVSFLRVGRYLTIAERLFGVGSMLSDRGYQENAMLNKVQIDFIYRERIWRSFSEFLMVVIPRLNFEKIKNQCTKLLRIDSKRENLTLAEKIKRDSNPTRCAICLKQPFNPFVIGCRHVFCYYCIYARYLTDESMGFTCNLCNYSTHNEVDVRRLSILIGER